MDRSYGRLRLAVEIRRPPAGCSHKVWSSIPSPCMMLVRSNLHIIPGAGNNWSDNESSRVRGLPARFSNSPLKQERLRRAPPANAMRPSDRQNENGFSDRIAIESGGGRVSRRRVLGVRQATTNSLRNCRLAVRARPGARLSDNDLRRNLQLVVSSLCHSFASF